MSRRRPHARRWLRSLVLALHALAVSAAAAPAQASDLNADGRGDLLWHHQATGELYVWLMNGTVAASGSYLSPARVADLGWQIRGLADFNADGKLDVLWHHQTTGDLYVWLMAGTSVSSAAYLTPSRGTDIGWQVKGVADLNGDARPDLLWQNQSGGEFSVWLMNGVTRASTVATTPAAMTDPQWQIRGLADFNGDGQPDVLWHHQATGDLYAWFMSGTSATGGSYLTPSRFADTRWQIRSLNDVNGDGKADLLWHHQTTGDLYAWLMNGTRVTAGSYLTPSRFADTALADRAAPPLGRRLAAASAGVRGGERPGPVNLRRAALRRAGQGGHRVAAVRLRLGPARFAGETGRKAALEWTVCLCRSRGCLRQARHRQQVRGIPCGLLREWMLHSQWEVHRMPQVHG